MMDSEHPGNVAEFQPKLTVNARFMADFMAAEPPCFALGLVEERKQATGFLTVRPDATIAPEVAQRGFHFGHALFGSATFEVIHFIFDFYGFKTYNILIDPNNPVVRTVVSTMVENDDYFFFAINPDHTVFAYQSELGQGDGDFVGLKTNLDRIQDSTTTPAQYDQALSQFEAHPQPPGTLLHWVCRDDMEYLHIIDDPLELRPS